MANEETKKKKSTKAPAKAKGKKAEKVAEAAPEKKTEAGIPTPRFKNRYHESVVPQMIERFGYRNSMQVPRLAKIVINMGVGEGTQNTKLVDSAVEELQTITGQRPNVRRARLSISNFRLREGTPVGAAVTLRRTRMWEFLDRLVTFSVPRIRDFQGLPRRGCDGGGYYTFGLKEQLIFPEIT
ncbi:MAG TPA: 50S ribosomal protein L5, partial [Firmicutes bacterium]|nr:50S ribosomal protein L5 [Bacillota bacterium]